MSGSFFRNRKAKALIEASGRIYLQHSESHRQAVRAGRLENLTNNPGAESPLLGLGEKKDAIQHNRVREFLEGQDSYRLTLAFNDAMRELTGGRPEIVSAAQGLSQAARRSVQGTVSWKLGELHREKQKSSGPRVFYGNPRYIHRIAKVLKNYFRYGSRNSKSIFVIIQYSIITIFVKTNVT